MNRARYSTIQTIFKKVTHVIFDLDGLLIDSESIYKQVVTELAKEHGKTYTREIRLKVIGRPAQVGAQIAVEEMNLPMKPEVFLNEWKERCNKLLANCSLMPGADTLIRHLHRRNVPIAIATSSSQESVDRKLLKHKELFSLFHHVVTGGSDPEVKRGKPHPDIFLVCASRFADNPKPSKCLVFEDSPSGVKAARMAGMQCIMVPEKCVSSEHTEDATQVVNSLEDINLKLFGLPPYTK